MKIVQNWLPYKDSLLFRYSDEYFKTAGQEAFSNEGKDRKQVVPNEMTNSITHARSIANFVKDHLEFYPKDQKIKILEVGSGSGIFAKNFLLCARELNILEKIEYLVSDYSKPSLEYIKSSKVLGDFQENQDFRFIYLDILNPESAQDLDGNCYTLEKISVSVLNYILCVLPLTTLRRNKSNQLEELFIRFIEKPHLEKDLEYIANLIPEYEWRNYEAQCQSKLEKKFLSELMDYINKSDFLESSLEYDFYSYNSLEVIENVLGFTDENGFIFIAEMPRLINAAQPYKTYANSIAHPLNDGLITSFVSSKNCKILRSLDKHYPLLRILVFKNSAQQKIMTERFTKEFLEKNDSNLLIELRKMIAQFTSKHSVPVMKKLIEQLLELDSYSYETHLLLARYFFLIGDIKQARIAYLKAKDLDFLNNLEIHSGALKKILELSYESY